MARVRVNIDDTQTILLKRRLNRNGKAQQFFTSEVRRQADPYVPFRQGGLKNFQVQVHEDKIHYKAPYAKKQYYENRGLAKEGTSNGGLRGKQWIPRMWSDKGEKVVEAVSKYVGGK